MNAVMLMSHIMQKRFSMTTINLFTSFKEDILQLIFLAIGETFHSDQSCFTYYFQEKNETRNSNGRFENSYHFFTLMSPLA